MILYKLHHFLLFVLLKVNKMYIIRKRKLSKKGEKMLYQLESFEIKTKNKNIKNEHLDLINDQMLILFVLK